MSVNASEYLNHTLQTENCTDQIYVLQFNTSSQNYVARNNQVFQICQLNLSKAGDESLKGRWTNSLPFIFIYFFKASSNISNHRIKNCQTLLHIPGTFFSLTFIIQSPSLGLRATELDLARFENFIVKFTKQHCPKPLDGISWHPPMSATYSIKVHSNRNQ